MKFRSWYLVLIGILIQAVFGLVLMFKANDTGDWGGLVLTIGGIVFFFSASLGIIPLLLLIFHKTRKVGAIASIAFGIIGVSIRMGIIVGVFMIIAGVLSLWRKD
jgi:hypothetical protein